MIEGRETKKVSFAIERKISWKDPRIGRELLGEDQKVLSYA